MSSSAGSSSPKGSVCLPTRLISERIDPSSRVDSTSTSSESSRRPGRRKGATKPLATRPRGQGITDLSGLAPARITHRRARCRWTYPTLGPRAISRPSAGDNRPPPLPPVHNSNTVARRSPSTCPLALRREQESRQSPLFKREERGEAAAVPMIRPNAVGSASQLETLGTPLPPATPVRTRRIASADGDPARRPPMTRSSVALRRR